MQPLQVRLALSLLLVTLVGATDIAWRDAFLNPAPGNNETVYVGTTYPVRWKVRISTLREGAAHQPYVGVLGTDRCPGSR